ncbi:hypothetical protein N8072_00840 [bacterium]|nr:hypothetical protein [bacterium]MDB4128761.1 hypothetical protein [bacterium]MDC1257206.1 hypothetical protein [bacterium]
MSSSETKAMQDILDKLSNAHTNPEPRLSSDGKVVPNSVSTDAKEMYSILEKLQSATANTESVETVVNESVSSTNDKSFTIGGINVTLDKRSVYGYKKTYYTICEDDIPLYTDLALFESTMAIIKAMLSNKSSSSVITRIVELDAQYSNQFDEAAGYKKRAKVITESTKYDVYMAKHSVSVGKMKNIKANIKKLL